MKVYELIFENVKGVNRVSFVKGAAVQTTLIKFASDEDKPLFFTDDEKRIIYCVAMRPGKMIFRSNVSGDPNIVEPAYVFYTAETIEKLQQNYYKQVFEHKNVGTNLNHEDENTDGIFPFENWTVKDPKNDKSTLMGLETIGGDWVMGFKVENNAVWEQCKNGDLDGLSVEFYPGYKETSINFNINKDEPMKKQLFAFILAFMMSADKKELAPGFWGISLEAGNPIVDKDGNPLPNVSFKIEDKDYETDANGLIKEPVVKAEGEDSPEAMKQKIADLEKENADLKEKANTAEAEKTKAETEVTKMSTQLTTVTAEKGIVASDLLTMTTEKAELETKVEKMAKHIPAGVSIDDAPRRYDFVAEKKYEDMTNAEKTSYNRKNK